MGERKGPLCPLCCEKVDIDQQAYTTAALNVWRHQQLILVFHKECHTKASHDQVEAAVLEVRFDSMLNDAELYPIHIC